MNNNVDLINSPIWENYATQPVDAEVIKHNRETLSKIETMLSSNQKIGLFVGRQASEELPHEEGVTWISLDIDGGNPIDPNRLHLTLDCNNSHHLAIIQDVFNKVVVDQSTWKFFETGIIDRLTSLLKVAATSSLIFENSFLFVHFNKIDEWHFNHIELTIPERELDLYFEQIKKMGDLFIEKIGGLNNLIGTPEYEKFIKQERDFRGEAFIASSSQDDLNNDFLGSFGENKVEHPKKRYQSLARQKTVDYLKTLFDNVELQLNTPFPYVTRYNSDEDNFFQAVGRKSLR